MAKFRSNKNSRGVLENEGKGCGSIGMIVLANFFEETEEYIVTNCIVLLPASRVTVSLRVRSFLSDASKS